MNTVPEPYTFPTHISGVENVKHKRHDRNIYIIICNPPANHFSISQQTEKIKKEKNIYSWMELSKAKEQEKAIPWIWLVQNGSVWTEDFERTTDRPQLPAPAPKTPPSFVATPTPIHYICTTTQPCQRHHFFSFHSTTHFLVVSSISSFNSCSYKYIQLNQQTSIILHEY